MDGLGFEVGIQRNNRQTQELARSLLSLNVQILCRLYLAPSRLLRRYMRTFS